MRHGWMMAAGLALVLSGCAHGGRKAAEPAAPAPPPAAKKGVDVKAEAALPEVVAWRTFDVRPGMMRSVVEASLGQPAQLSRTKEGRIYAMYQMKVFWRSVVYDDNGLVVEVYP